MKNIKFFRYLGLVISAGLLLGFSSCSDDDDYAPGNPAPDNCMGVYFDAGNAAEFILTPDQETVDVKVCRKVAAEAASVPVKVEYTDTTAIQVPATVEFAQGEKEATLTISVKGLTPKKKFGFKIDVDEAYADFTDPDLLPDLMPYIKAGKNVINIHTFSKYYGLAGGRIGYLVANPAFINWYDTVSEPFNANRMGLAGAVALMEHPEEPKKYGDLMIKDRTWMNEELTKMGCAPIDSQANFVFFQCPYPADEVAEILLQNGVIVRPCTGWGFDHFLRISIGTTEQNKVVLAKLQEAFDKLGD